MLQSGKIIKLSNNKEYIVVMSKMYKGAEYVYLINLNNKEDFIFAKHEGNTIAEVIDEALTEELLLLFAKEYAG